MLIAVVVVIAVICRCFLIAATTVVVDDGTSLLPPCYRSIIIWCLCWSRSRHCSLLGPAQKLMPQVDLASQTPLPIYDEKLARATGSHRCWSKYCLDWLCLTAFVSPASKHPKLIGSVDNPYNMTTEIKKYLTRLAYRPHHCSNGSRSSCAPSGHDFFSPFQ